MKQQRALLAGTAALAGGSALFALAACMHRPASSASQVTSDMSVCVDPLAMPSGYGYPAREATVAGWVERRDTRAIREHGWSLFAAMNTAPDPDGEGVGRSWCTATPALAGATAPTPAPVGAAPATAARAATGQVRSLNAIRAKHGEPINFRATPQYRLPAAILNDPAYRQCIVPAEGETPAGLTDGAVFQSNGDIMIAGVIYNRDAYDWIRSRGLYRTAALRGLQPASATGQAEMPEMPAGSIVLKPMMWPVPQDGVSALPIWDGPDSDHDRYAGFEVHDMWPRAVAVTTDPASEGRRISGALQLNGVTLNGVAMGPSRYPDMPVVGTGRFYRYTPDLAALGACDRALLDASAWWAYGKRFRQGDQLVLIAMHAMTKEQRAWTFQSFWWHDRPDAGPYAADRPALPNAQGPWRHYLMTETYGTTMAPGGTQWPVAYNPYIELAAAHTIETNCMNCHHRAAWSDIRADRVSYQLEGGPDALAVFDQRNAIFDGIVKVDSMWAISSRVPNPRPTPGPVGTQ